MEIVWDHLDQIAWDQHLCRAGCAPLQQSWDYGTGMSALGARVRRAVVLDAGCAIAQVQVLENRVMRLINRGPVWLAPLSDCQKRSVLRQLARRAGLTIATPERGLAGFGILPLITPRHHALWDLAPDPVTLRAGMDPNWRAALLQAERVGPVLRAHHPGALDTLIRAEALQRRIRRYRGLPGQLAQGWPARQRLVLDWADHGQVQAGMVFLIHAGWATYHIGWASDLGRAAQVHRPLLWQAVLHLRARGVSVLDLGNLDATNPGLARFKRGTGAAIVSLGATALVLPGLHHGLAG